MESDQYTFKYHYHYKYYNYYNTVNLALWCKLTASILYKENLHGKFNLVKIEINKDTNITDKCMLHKRYKNYTQGKTFS